MRVTNRSPFRRTPKALKLVPKAKEEGDETPDEVEILLYEEIGYWGITAREFVQELKAIDAPTIRLRINSPGGDVFDGIAMYNALRDHKAKIIVHVDGLAASAASVIAMAGDEIHMAETALLMIHNAWTIALGNADDFRKLAETLEKIDSSLVKAYVNRTGATTKQVKDWMSAETWFTADEAKDAGFIDEVDAQNPDESEEVEEALAAFDLSVFQHAPERLVAAAGRRSAPTVRDVETALRDAGLSRQKAKAVAALASKLDEEERDAPTDEYAAAKAAGQQLLNTLTSY